MAPVVFALRRSRKWNVKILATAQHREMLDQVLRTFDIVPDLDLNVMRPNQALADLTSRLMTGMDACLKEHQPNLVLAQGDTTTVLVAALASFYQRIPFGHVEAGLRTHNLDYPWPEEMNRVVTGRLASINFAPTKTARDNLLHEGIATDSIHVTGNTVIDALFMVAERDYPLRISLPSGRRIILVTAHRRENFGLRMVSICKAIRGLARMYEDLHFLFPVHPNPNVRQVVRRELGALSKVTLCEPLGYGAFVTAMKRAYLVLTDSGGVQEEAPALAKPVLVLRDETERPEAIREGVAELVGTETQRIVDRMSTLLDDEDAYRKMAKGSSPYGDGKAAERIAQCIENLL
jgi:UDP-N-acetylglucosamine 2-epimerase (non-hydrolysing)